MTCGQPNVAYILALRAYGSVNSDDAYFHLPEDGLLYDFSALNYYRESGIFTNWAESKLNGIQVDTGEKAGDKLESLNVKDAENEDSAFAKHKKFVIKNIITDNLNLAISSYSARNSLNFELPIFTYEDWEKIFSNVSMTAFVQEIPIGLKNYNNYVIAVSSQNKEYISPEEIYYIDVGDRYYHLQNCPKIENTAQFIGYRNIDFLSQAIIKTEVIDNNNIREEVETTLHYFKHAEAGKANEKCYYCLVAKKMHIDILGPDKTYQRAYFRAIARERFVQKK